MKRNASHLLSEYFYLSSLRKALNDVPVGASQLEYLLTYARREYGFLFHEKPQVLREFTAKLRDHVYQDDEQLAQAGANSICKIAKAHFTRAQLETHRTRTGAFIEGAVELNCVLDYKISGKAGRSLKLHLRPTSKLTIATLRDAFRVLAQRVQQGGPLQRIEAVCVTSWIVIEHPNLIKGLGFMLAPTRAPGVGNAVMTRDTLLRRYGKASDRLLERGLPGIEE